MDKGIGEGGIITGSPESADDAKPGEGVGVWQRWLVKLSVSIGNGDMVFGMAELQYNTTNVPMFAGKIGGN